MKGIIYKLLSKIATKLSHFEKQQRDEIIRSLNLESQEELNIRFIGGKLPSMRVGTGTYINGIDLYCWDSAVNISIGRYCSIADKVTVIAGGEHDKHWVSTYPFIPRWNLTELTSIQEPRYKGDINIGNDVWIGGNTIILSGTSIADGATIGAGSVVTKDIPPYSVAAGNPAKVIKMRFSEEIVSELLNIKWWEWEESKIKVNVALFKDVNKFISQCK